MTRPLRNLISAVTLAALTGLLVLAATPKGSGIEVGNGGLIFTVQKASGQMY